ncbi:serine/threonine protein kinase [Kibdelosporangium philippinense]|uniref:non-specific serine/threonine protein kinase n=1 Tax=Kibdelosporangium philippinense TaxID=211113 RepID=A0ABS8ZEL6_9PSEU|nr:serine/threonine-protein kinase [Kibdelosporangium philippinense]MCE7006215.1 serine/threonine protein kinase [Kibdelosporangium philippinense]
MYEESGGRAAPVLADRYRLISLLGRGGTARVLRAWDQRLDREVAVKIFQPHADPVGRLRFEDEAKLLAGFDHPGLVKVFDSGVAAGEPFLVLELVNGPQLGHRIDEGPMSVDEVRAIGIGIAKALAYVHSKNVVHRDIKPGNILLDADGVPHLADFGLAKLLARSGITASDRLVGTAAYLSPEQVLGTEVGPPADIYGLGLILLECVTGEIEYPGLDAETVLARLGRRPNIPDDIPKPLAEALDRMTRTEPAERPTAAECVDLLRAEAPAAVPEPRRRIASKAAAIVGAGLTAGAIALFVSAPTTDTNTPVRIQPDNGAVISGESSVPQQQPVNQQREQPRPSDKRDTVAKTPGPTSTPPVVEETVVEEEEPVDPTNPSKTKKTKTNTKTKTKTPAQTS